MVTRIERLRTGFIDCLLKQKEYWRSFHKHLRKFERQAIRRYLDYLKFPDKAWGFSYLTIETIYAVNHDAREAYKSLKKKHQ